MDAVFLSANVRRAAKRVLIVSCVVLGSVALPSQVQAKSLFDILFGANSIFAPAPSPLYRPGYDTRGAPLRSSRDFAPRRKAAKPDQKPEKYTPPEVMPGPLGQFLRDPTLRRGDVVTTQKGLMVFRGQGGAHHSERDFVALSNAAGFAAGNKANLAALENALKRGRTSLHVGELLASFEPVETQNEPQPGKKRRR
jgi:hypothetical protein